MEYIICEICGRKINKHREYYICPIHGCWKKDYVTGKFIHANPCESCIYRQSNVLAKNKEE